MIGRFNVAGVSCLYEINADGNITITGYEGNDSRIIVPDIILIGDKEYYVSSIGKKAFMGAVFLKEISLPSTIKEFGEWSFAHCSNLEKLIVRWGNDYKKPFLGRGSFESCNKLVSLCLGYDKDDDLSVLLASLAWRLPVSYLLNDSEIGTDYWFVSYDKALVSFLSRKDDEGATDRVLCGEEDISYDGIASVDGELLSDGINYMIESRKSKAYLCFLRLAYSSNLWEEYKKIYADYLVSHGKNSKTEEAWLVLKELFANKIEYFKIFESIGGINTNYIDDMLMDLGEEYAEAKAYLINYKQEHAVTSDFFSKMMITF